MPSVNDLVIQLNSLKSPFKSTELPVPLLDFVKGMKDPKTGVERKARTVVKSNRVQETHHDSFIGSEAVEWTAKKLSLERSEACKILQNMLINGIIVSVDHTTSKFVDGQFIYRFN